MHGVVLASHAELAAHPDVMREVDAAVARGNQRLSRVEQVKKYVVLPEVWSFDGDELTPTGKLKRKAIATKYSELIDRLYASEVAAPIRSAALQR